MKITDDMLSAQAAEARANCGCKPARRMRCPSTVSPENPGVKCAVWCVHKSTLQRSTGASVLRAARPCSAAFRCGFVRLRDERRGIPRIAYQYCRARV